MHKFVCKCFVIILIQEADVEMMERLNRLESTLAEIMHMFEKKTVLMLQHQEEMNTKIEGLQQQLNRAR